MKQQQPPIRISVVVFLFFALAACFFLTWNLSHQKPESVFIHTQAQAAQDIEQVTLSIEAASKTASSNEVQPMQVTVGVSATMDEQQQFARPSTNDVPKGPPAWFIEKQRKHEQTNK